MRSAACAGPRHRFAATLGCAAALSGVAGGPVCAQGPPVSSIRVTGNAQVTAAPDRVQIDVGVSTRAPTSEEAAVRNARAVSRVLAAVRGAGGPTAVLKTISYALNPNYQYHPQGEPTLDGYTASNVVRVQLDDLAKIGPATDAATGAGANRVEGIQFTLRDAQGVRAQALREAAGRARAEADVLAAALGLKIMRVLTVEENSPQIMPLRVYGGAPAMAKAAAVPTPIEAGTLDVSAAVTLSVEVSAAGH